MALIKFFLVVIRTLLKSRYKLKFKGEDVFDSQKPVLLLPNHQAVVDPMLLVTKLAKKAIAVPVMTESYYDIPVLKLFFKKWGVVRVADLQKGSRDTNVLSGIATGVKEALAEGRTVLLYPAGQITGQGFEKIFNKKSAYQIVQELPDGVDVVGVRISGLWGSMWSRAWTGDSPKFGKVLFRSLWYVLANGIFFVPRRKVTMEFVKITEDAVKASKGTHVEFNTFLEEFYNINGEEKHHFLRHYFWGRKPKRELPPVIKGSVHDVVNAGGKYRSVDPKVFRKVKEIVASHLEGGNVEIRISSNLHLDIGMDSISLVDVFATITDEFKVDGDVDVELLKTVGDLCLLAMGKLTTKSDLKPSTLYQHKLLDEMLEVDPEMNILDHYIYSFSKHKNQPFAYDAIMGSTTRKQFLMKSIAVSKLIKKNVPDERVGIMLPALQSSALLIASCYLAGKVPVMFNWTVGKQVLNHCVETSGVKTVLTATNFYNKVKDQLSDEIVPKLMFFEKKLPELTLSDKLGSLFAASFTSLIKKPKLDKTAVVLFTSGSENVPKAVELTHENIMNDLYGTLENVHLKNQLIMLGFLPPFHSFGFSVLGILPLVTGLKIAYAPNPTDTADIVKMLRHTKASIMVGTPTFLKNILNIATPHDIQTMELVVSGAESMPERLLEQLKRVNQKARVLEGYGITECSPVVSVNPVHKQKLNSVGLPIKGATVIIGDVETYKQLPPNTEGMILIAGKSVFGGYVDKKIASPFVEVEGTQYYVSGDLGKLDEDGYLYITGRLKRFIKKGGEMISLPFIERILSEHYGRDGENPVAVEGTDKDGVIKVVMFTQDEIKKQEANDVLRSNGVAPIAFLTNVEHIEEMPMLGSGKVDYKKLKKIVES